MPIASPQWRMSLSWRPWNPSTTGMFSCRWRLVSSTIRRPLPFSTRYSLSLISPSSSSRSYPVVPTRTSGSWRSNACIKRP
ncbi:hypothetical protein D3C80_1661640 [compost metagenome]